jgi:hypothetical protein
MISLIERSCLSFACGLCSSVETLQGLAWHSLGDLFSVWHTLSLAVTTEVGSHIGEYT